MVSCPERDADHAMAPMWVLPRGQMGNSEVGHTNIGGKDVLWRWIPGSN